MTKNVLPIAPAKAQADTPAPFPARALSEEQAAAYIGSSRNTLRQKRCDGSIEGRMAGPPFCKIGRKIVYLKDDLDTWLESYRRTA